MGSELSGYTFDLFKTISTIGGIDVRFLYNPVDGLPSFQHEETEGRSPNRRWWKDTSWSQMREFICDPPPDAVFFYGNRPRVRMNAALAWIPATASVFYAADTNIVELVRRPGKTVGRHFACAPMARRATAALSLGLTNRLALQALGFSRTVELPVYAVDFGALDAAAAGVEANESRTDDDEIVVLVIARLTPVKNLPGFVRAFAKESNLSRRVRLVIAGEGPDRGALEEIQSRTPSLRMELLGPVPRRHVGALFRRADVLLLPSLEEPWGIVVVEALGMGMPVVATPAVGSAVSLAGYTGAILLSDSTEARSIVLALRRFVEQQIRLTTSAHECMQYIRTRYDRLAVAGETIRLVYGDRGFL